MSSLFTVYNLHIYHYCFTQWNSLSSELSVVSAIVAGCGFGFVGLLTRSVLYSDWKHTQKRQENNRKTCQTPATGILVSSYFYWLLLGLVSQPYQVAMAVASCFTTSTACDMPCCLCWLKSSNHYRGEQSRILKFFIDDIFVALKQNRKNPGEKNKQLAECWPVLIG